MSTFSKNEKFCALFTKYKKLEFIKFESGDCAILSLNLLMIYSLCVSIMHCLSVVEQAIIKSHNLDWLLGCKCNSGCSRIRMSFFQRVTSLLLLVKPDLHQHLHDLILVVFVINILDL